MEEGGPMKAIVGCRRRQDIPKEIAVVFGEHEFILAVAIRDLIEEGGLNVDQKKEGDEDERKQRDHGAGKRGEQKRTSDRTKGRSTEFWSEDEKRAKEDAGSSAPEKKRNGQSSVPVWVTSNLGETSKEKEKGESGIANLGVNDAKHMGDSSELDLTHLKLAKEGGPSTFWGREESSRKELGHVKGIMDCPMVACEGGPSPMLGREESSRWELGHEKGKVGRQSAEREGKSKREGEGTCVRSTRRPNNLLLRWVV